MSGKGTARGLAVRDTSKTPAAGANKLLTGRELSPTKMHECDTPAAATEGQQVSHDVRKSAVGRNAASRYSSILHKACEETLQEAGILWKHATNTH